MNLLHATRTDYKPPFHLKKIRKNFNASISSFKWRKPVQASFFFLLFFLSNLPFSKANLLECPIDTTIFLDTCAHSYQLDYEVFEWNSPVPFVDTIFNPPQGTILEHGMHLISIIGIDNQGDSSTCEFTLNLFDSMWYLICNDNTEVTLEEDCHQEITYDIILEGEANVCADEVQISVKDQIGQIIASGQSVNAQIDWIGKIFIVEVVSLFTQNKCWGQLKILPPTIMKITCPPDKTVFCVEPTDPTKTGFPTFESCFDEHEIDLTYYDQTNPLNCPDSLDYSLTRIWTAENPLGETNQCQQIISAKRFSESDIIFPPDFDNIDQPAFECQSGMSYLEIADTSQAGVPSVNGYFADNITCDFTVTFEDSILNICGETYEIERYWRVIDWCSSNVTKHTQVILIEDTQAPIFEIVDTIWVSSTIDCGNDTEIPPAIVLDECNDISFEIELPFETMNTNGGTGIVILSNGVQEAHYTLTDACGNSATQTATIIVEPESLLKCPPNVTIDCSFYLAELETPISNGDYEILSQFDDPIFHANCLPELIETVNVQIDNCGEGIIQRQLTTTNFQNEKTCIQNITVNHVSDFTVTFPEDLKVECVDSSFPETGEPEIKSADCENIEVTYQDIVYTAVPDACYKIVRQWTVINHCIYDSTLHNVTVETAETYLYEPQVCDLDGDGDCDRWTYKDGVKKPLSSGAKPDGIIYHEQSIKVTDEIKPDFEDNFKIEDICTSDGCKATFTLPMPEVYDCGDVNVTVSGSLGTGFGPFTNVPIGVYTFIYVAQDNCGNSNAMEAQLEVIPCEPPKVQCKEPLTIQINPNTYVAGYSAYSLLDQSIGSCLNNVYYSLSEDIFDEYKAFNCFELGVYPAELWVTYDDGSQDSCQTTITVQDTSNVCENLPGYIDGLIVTEDDEFVNFYDIFLESPNGHSDSLINYSGGNFSFIGVEAGEDYTLTPKKDINYLNGVTTFDMVLIQKHILHVKYLDSPYKLIAADVNNSGAISISDVVQLKKLIIHVDDSFPNNDSWRFVDFPYEFPDPTNPWLEPFPEVIELNPFAGISDCIIFIGVKIGDVNNSANPTSLLNTNDRNGLSDLNFTIQNQEFKKGDIVNVPFSMDETSIAGYQFTLEFDQEILEFQNVISGKSYESDFGKTDIENGFLTTSWLNMNNYNQSSPDRMFTLSFRAKSDGDLINLIEINSRKIPSEAYSNELELLDVQLNVIPSNEDDFFDIIPPQPNPFLNTSQLGFYLPNDSNVEIEIFNSAGDLIISKKDTYFSGRNYLEINRKDLKHNGIYYFQIKTNNQTKTGKMILLE